MAEKITRGDTNMKRPVARIKLAQFTFADGVITASTKELPFTGIVTRFVTVVNNNTGNATATVAFVDEDSYTIHSTSGIAENATTCTTITTPLHVPAGCSISVTPSGDPGESGMTVDVVVYGTA